MNSDVREPGDLGGALVGAVWEVDEPDDFRLPQVYETTVCAPGLPHFRFVTVPNGALGGGIDDLTDILHRLDLDPGEGRSILPADLPSAMWRCLTEGRRELPSGPREDWVDEDLLAFTFAEYLAFEDLIPFEASPQESRSGTKLMVSGAGLGAALGAGAAGAKVGTATGVVIGAGAGPLVIIAAFGGFVIGGVVGAVTGVLGDKAAETLREKLA